MNDQTVRESIARWGKSLFERGLTSGSSGNISVATANGYIATPTNSCLGFLDPDRLSILDAEGRHVSGDQPTKELPLHFGIYRNTPSARAVVHLHSTHATALSCLADTDVRNAIPPITPYVVMRLGHVPLVEYFRPGAAEAETLIAEKAKTHSAMLLQNHGPIVSGDSLDAAIFAMEELEEAAKLVLLTRAMPLRLLDGAAVEDLREHFIRRTHA
jgi:ribulose-5-phosphate 4-epimerase/fuculose-1-phosphate aldolase